MGLLAALVVCGFASTSYAQESCAANMKELESHPEAKNGCGRQDLDKQYNRVPQGVLSKSVLGGLKTVVIQFKKPSEKQNFYVIVDGKETFGKICCTQGKWSIQGMGAIKILPNGVEIGNHRFMRDDRRVDYQGRYQTARLATGLK